MAFAWIDRVFGARHKGVDPVARLYQSVVEAARQPDWYVAGSVPDSMAGRFEVLCAMMSLVLVRLRALGEPGRRVATDLSQTFARDIEQQLREDGFGDAGLVKQVSAAMAALSGQTDTLAEHAQNGEDLAPWIARNFATGVSGDANLAWRTTRVAAIWHSVSAKDIDLLLEKGLAL